MASTTPILTKLASFYRILSKSIEKWGVLDKKT